MDSLSVAIQPSRGYNIDAKSTYHDPALVPPHGYLAFYFWLRHHFGAHAIIHNGDPDCERIIRAAQTMTRRVFETSVEHQRTHGQRRR